MRIQINGETKEVPENLSLQSLIEHLSLPNQRVAIELDQEVVRKSQWPTTTVEEDSRIEIVHFVGGG
jgi:sulfur carrier protein